MNTALRAYSIRQYLIDLSYLRQTSVGIDKHQNYFRRVNALRKLNDTLTIQKFCCEATFDITVEILG